MGVRENNYSATTALVATISNAAKAIFPASVIVFKIDKFVAFIRCPRSSSNLVSSSYNLSREPGLLTTSNLFVECLSEHSFEGNVMRSEKKLPGQKYRTL